MNYELYEYYIGYKGDVYKWLKYTYLPYSAF